MIKTGGDKKLYRVLLARYGKAEVCIRLRVGAGSAFFSIFKRTSPLEMIEEMILNWPFHSPVLASGLRTSSHALASSTCKNLVNQERIMKESLLGTISLTPRTNSSLMGHTNRKMKGSLSKRRHLIIVLLVPASLAGFYCIYLFLCVLGALLHMCTHVKVRRQLVGISPLIWSPELKSDDQTCQQAAFTHETILCGQLWLL